MTEILRRIDLGIYDADQYRKARAWIKANCPDGLEVNAPELRSTPEQKEAEWDFVAKMTVICRDIMVGNPKLAEMGFVEESNGRNAIFGGFQGQRMWTDYKPNADFTEAIFNSGFDWNGKRQPLVLATENDNLNGVAMLFLHLLTNRSAVFADVRTYWSPEAVKRVTGYTPVGAASNGFIHLINSGAAALDGSGASRDADGRPVMKEWWNLTEEDIKSMLSVTKWRRQTSCISVEAVSLLSSAQTVKCR